MTTLSKAEFDAIRSANDYPAYKVATKAARRSRLLTFLGLYLGIITSMGIGILAIIGNSNAVAMAWQLHYVQSDVLKWYISASQLNRVRTAIAVRYAGAPADSPVTAAGLAAFLHGEPRLPDGSLVNPWGGRLDLRGSVGAPIFLLDGLPYEVCLGLNGPGTVGHVKGMETCHPNRANEVTVEAFN